MRLSTLTLSVLSIGLVAAQTTPCSQDIPGFEKSGVCCSASCGTCGGSGCGDLEGGNDKCCTSAIKGSGKMCSDTGEAPCILDSVPTPEDQMTICSNGFFGVEKNDICCSASCGTCGGSGCGGRSGGSEECCTSAIKDKGLICSDTGVAPCIMNADDMDPVPGGPFACDGDDGILEKEFCCSAGCKLCGGTGCSKQDNGLTGEDCCHGAIRDSGRLCSETGAAPCVMDGEAATPTTTPTSPPASTGTGESCSNGINGIEQSRACCSAACKACGGPGCSNLDGGDTKCCTSTILESGVMCSIAGEAPCIVDDDVDDVSGSTPAPATPTPPSPTTPTTNDGEIPMCRNGFYGVQDKDFCCPAECGYCGGEGCGTREGVNCCTDASDASCSEKGAAPCVLDPLSRDYKKSDCDHTTTIDLSNPSMAYLKSGGCASLTDVYNAQSGDGPLYVLGADDTIVNTAPTGRWLLTASLVVEDNVTLFVKGTGLGGDCDVLRIQSTDDDFWELTGHGGSLHFEGTKVTSWDTEQHREREYQGDPEQGRSFVRCITQFDDTGIYDCQDFSDKDKGTCRMDILDSTMGNMGYFASESYGLSWKVRGLCTITGKLENLEIFENTNVYGDIKNSDIYGMYYGHYSYGHQDGVWTNNKMHGNVEYGFDPHDDSDDLIIAHNEVYDNGNHGIIASKRCNNVKIYNNTVSHGGKVGIFLHRSSDFAEVYDNNIFDNKDAGIAFFESFNGNIHDNKVTNCKYGIRLSVGASDNEITNNVFTNIGFRDGGDDDSSPGSGFYTYEGGDEPEASNGRPSRNTFEGNTLSDAYLSVAIENGDDNVFHDNKFINSGKFEFEDSTDTVWTQNEIEGGCIDDDQNDKADLARGSDEIPVCKDD